MTTWPVDLVQSAGRHHRSRVADSKYAPDIWQQQVDEDDDGEGCAGHGLQDAHAVDDIDHHADHGDAGGCHARPPGPWPHAVGATHP